MTKVCTICKVDKDLEQYHLNKLGKLGRQARCKDCTKDYQREYRKNKPLTYDYRRNMRLKTTYGITSVEYDVLFLAQKGLCGICNEPSDELLVVDHCHDTGQVRGLLCRLCNSGIGKLRDDITLLQAAIAYLEKGNRN